MRCGQVADALVDMRGDAVIVGVTVGAVHQGGQRDAVIGVRVAEVVDARGVDDLVRTVEGFAAEPAQPFLGYELVGDTAVNRPIVDGQSRESEPLRDRRPRYTRSCSSRTMVILDGTHTARCARGFRHGAQVQTGVESIRQLVSIMCGLGHATTLAQRRPYQRRPLARLPPVPDTPSGPHGPRCASRRAVRWRFMATSMICASSSPRCRSEESSGSAPWRLA